MGHYLSFKLLFYSFFPPQVCTIPRDYQGYDKVLGLCICQTDRLENICDSQCRRQQRDILQIICAEENPQLFITYRNGSKVKATVKFKIYLFFAKLSRLGVIFLSNNIIFLKLFP